MEYFNKKIKFTMSILFNKTGNLFYFISIFFLCMHSYGFIALIFSWTYLIFNFFINESKGFKIISILILFMSILYVNKFGYYNDEFSLFYILYYIAITILFHFNNKNLSPWKVLLLICFPLFVHTLIFLYFSLDRIMSLFIEGELFYSTFRSRAAKIGVNTQLLISFLLFSTSIAYFTVSERKTIIDRSIYRILLIISLLSIIWLAAHRSAIIGCVVLFSCLIYQSEVRSFKIYSYVSLIFVVLFSSFLLFNFYLSGHVGRSIPVIDILDEFQNAYNKQPEIWQSRENSSKACNQISICKKNKSFFQRLAWLKFSLDFIYEHPEGLGNDIHYPMQSALIKEYPDLRDRNIQDIYDDSHSLLLDIGLRNGLVAFYSSILFVLIIFLLPILLFFRIKNLKNEFLLMLCFQVVIIFFVFSTPSPLNLILISSILLTSSVSFSLHKRLS